MDSRFLASIKNALKCLASINDERNDGFPLNLKNSLSSISRLSAYLHLFHHQVRDSLRLQPFSIERLSGYYTHIHIADKI